MKKSILEKIFSAPAEILERGVEVGKEIEEDLQKEKPVQEVKKYWKTLGPGFITGAADDDPSGIATYSQMGAQKGFGLIWLSLFSFPLMAVVQEMCARIGLATGVGLATNIRRHFSKEILYLATFLLLIANIFNIGANLGAMAESIRLVLPNFNFFFLVIFFTFFSLFLQVFIPYKKYSQYLKYLALVLFAYVFSAFLIQIDWLDVFKHLVWPQFSLNKEEIILICAAFGTTISPYLFFWQTAEEVEEKISRGEKTEEMRKIQTDKEEIKNMRIDVWSGMFLSNAIMFFIIATCGATLHKYGINNINTAAEAALALRPLAGNLAFALFALGLIGVGLLSIPVLAGSASYAMAETFHWKMGLNKKLKRATAFYGVIILAMVLGMLMNFIGLDPIKSLLYAAVLNGLVAPLILFLILKISASQDIMGNFKNKRFTNLVGWLTAVLLCFIGLLTVIFIFR